MTKTYLTKENIVLKKREDKKIKNSKMKVRMNSQIMNNFLMNRIRLKRKNRIIIKQSLWKMRQNLWKQINNNIEIKPMICH